MGWARLSLGGPGISPPALTLSTREAKECREKGCTTPHLRPQLPQGPKGSSLQGTTAPPPRHTHCQSVGSRAVGPGRAPKSQGQHCMGCCPPPLCRAGGGPFGGWLLTLGPGPRADRQCRLLLNRAPAVWPAWALPAGSGLGWGPASAFHASPVCTLCSLPWQEADVELAAEGVPHALVLPQDPDGLLQLLILHQEVLDLPPEVVIATVPRHPQRPALGMGAGVSWGRPTQRSGRPSPSPSPHCWPGCLAQPLCPRQLL